MDETLNKGFLNIKISDGIRWQIANQLFTKPLNLLISLLLARLLFPEAFGLMGMLLLFSNLAKQTIFLSFRILIIQSSIESRDYKSSVFWYLIAFSLSTSILFLLCLPGIATLFREPILLTIGYFIALDMFITSLGTIPLAFLYRSFQFKKIFFLSLFSEIFSGMVSVFLAFKGFEVWSLVNKLICYNLLFTVLSWHYSQLSLGFQISKKHLFSTLKFTIPLSGTAILNYWVRNLDDLIVGKVLGAFQLGLYNKAYQLMILPVSEIAGASRNVFLPVFSTIKEDNSLLRELFLKLSSIIALITFPAMLLLFALPDLIIPIILGKAWNPLIPLLSFLAPAGMIQSVITLTGLLFIVKEATLLQFRLKVFTACISIISILIGVNFGLLGLSIGILIATLLNLGPNVYFASQQIDLGLFEWFKNLVPVFFSTSFMIGTVCSIRFFLLMEITPQNLFILIFIGLITYYWTLRIFRIKAYLELRKLIFDHLWKK